jgi:hypothetical protein
VQRLQLGGGERRICSRFYSHATRTALHINLIVRQEFAQRTARLIGNACGWPHLGVAMDLSRDGDAMLHVYLFCSKRFPVMISHRFVILEIPLMKCAVRVYPSNVLCNRTLRDLVDDLVVCSLHIPGGYFVLIPFSGV